MKKKNSNDILKVAATNYYAVVHLSRDLPLVLKRLETSPYIF